MFKINNHLNPIIIITTSALTRFIQTKYNYNIIIAGLSVIRFYIVQYYVIVINHRLPFVIFVLHILIHRSLSTPRELCMCDNILSAFLI